MTYVIEKTIPIPAPTRTLPPPVADMEIGDSILTSYVNRSGAACAFTLAARRASLDHSFVTAKDGDFVRVWRKS